MPGQQVPWRNVADGRKLVEGAATTLQAWIESASRRFVEVQIAVVLPAIADVMAPRSDAPHLRPDTECGGSGDVEPVVAAATQVLDGTVGEGVLEPARLSLVGASPTYTTW
jgi:hypothetical protein